MQKRHKPSIIAAIFGRLGKDQKKPASGATAPRPYQSIGIYHGTVCCAAAKQVEGYRFLARNAPQLPLSDCTMRRACECRYMKFQDRRGGSRRSIEFGLKPTLFAASEKRKKNGRRSKD
jgi:hypothetical protein